MILHGDCLDKLKELPDNSVDAIVTDPPYGLSFMGKKWDYDVPSKDVWVECLRVLKPGGYLLSFAGTRTQHRMAVNIEDAGFEIRDMIAWVYGSGFPKSLNIGKAVDKLQGNERETLGLKRKAQPSDFGLVNDDGWQPKDLINTKGTSEWEGWGTALKPALEPITVARKPLAEKTVAENVLKWGTGGINIDGSRVGTEVETWPKTRSFTSGISSGYTEGVESGTQETGQAPSGRFPANLIHDGSEEVTSLFPDSKSTGGNGSKFKNDSEYVQNHSPRYIEDGEFGLGYGDSGSAARFFYCAKASKSERNRGCGGLELTINICVENTEQDTLAQRVISEFTKMTGYEWSITWSGNDTTVQSQMDTKSTTETETSRTTPLKTLSLSTLLRTSESIVDVIRMIGVCGLNLVESAENLSKSLNTTNESQELARGARVVVSETPLKINASVKRERNGHPTIKPIALMEYLVKLVSREGATVLDPFAGSGSTLIACKNLGRKFIGIEREEEYIKIIEARLNAVKDPEKQLELV